MNDLDIVGRSHAHNSARQHVTGAAIYLDDMAETSDCLHAAIVKSPHAHARIVRIDATRALAHEGVVAFVRAADIPGVNDVGPAQHGEPALAEEIADYVGCPIGAIVATSHEAARRMGAPARIALIGRSPCGAELCLPAAGYGFRRCAGRAGIRAPHVERLA